MTPGQWTASIREDRNLICSFAINWKTMVPINSYHVFYKTQHITGVITETRGPEALTLRLVTC